MHPHAAQQTDGGGDVMQVRQIADGDFAVRQKGSGQDRQGGVFGARNTDLSLQGGAASNNQFIHRKPQPAAVSDGQGKIMSLGSRAII